MKDLLEQLLSEAVQSLQQSHVLPADASSRIDVSRSRDSQHGDYASNLAMMLAKRAGTNPRDLAGHIIDALPASERIEKIEIAGPGFINFFMLDTERSAIVAKILEAGDKFGFSETGKGKRVQVEFVSANPTGPLHVGHGRGAATGACIANLLSAVGYDVQREYYVNDAGRQMDILATSVWLRYLGLCGETVTFPANGYKGDYIYAIAETLKQRSAGSLVHAATSVFDNLPPDEPAGGDKEAHIDALVTKAQTLLGKENYRAVFDLALDNILDDIRDDLADFGVVFDNWFSERSISDEVELAIEKLKATEHLYQKEGAWWFRSTDFGDEKDRVVVRDNGQTTYFASDIAYMMNKMERGFDHVVYLFGSDHHGYVGRMLAACDALGYDRERLDFLLIQFANLWRSGERQQMSTRSGEFVTIRQLRDEVGKDAARYFYVMRRYQQHLDFDLDLAKSQTRDNPVYYVQYAHARICSVMRQARDKGVAIDVIPGEPLGSSSGADDLDRLTESHESELVTLLGTYPEMIERAARLREPHLVTTYLQELANALNKYYEAHKWLIDDEALRRARLCLILAARQVLANGLRLLDVSAPEVL